MFIVTGGAGFIGSNIVAQLNARGITDIIVVDNLKNGQKFKNLVDLEIADYIDKEQFLKCILANDDFGADIQAIFHQGACSSTTEWDGKFMMDNNYTYSKALLHYALERGVQFMYASSAATYGAGEIFKEERGFEAPLNVYGYSKFQFDQYVRRVCKDVKTQVAGFRYFNVYGPREFHKGSMSSVAYHFNQQISAGENVKLFEGYDGYDNGEQRRDFVFVEDVADVNLWFYDNPKAHGIFNLGTGRSQSFNDVAKAVIAWHKKGKIEYIPFPDHLKGHYQSFTQADISALRNAGYNKEFKTVEQGVKSYLDWMHQQEHA